VHAEPKLEVPYLPDPMADGALLMNLPGLPFEAVQVGRNRIPFTGAWPEVTSFRLKLVGIDAGQTPAPPALTETAAERVLTVQLPEAETVTIRLSSYFDVPPPGSTPPDPPPGSPPPDLTGLDVMGMWQWIDERSPASEKTKLRDEVGQGRNWLLMPYRQLVLVHAVKQPLQPASIASATATKTALGQTYADVAASLNVHAKSTSKVDLLAAWRDPEDDPTDEANDPRTAVRAGRANVGEITVLDPGVGKVSSPPLKLPFGDTKHHRVLFRTRATSRFREYYPPSTPVSELALDDQPEPPDIDADDPKLLRVPSSARPGAPKVAYVIPTFRWTRTADGDTMTSIREAGGLRVYLERPWFSSGVGELLGVVFVPGGPLSQNDKRRRFATSWGADPVWDPRGPDPSGALSAASFPGAEVEGNLTLASLGTAADERVSVAGYEVEYDPDRRLWYADLRLDLGPHYFPFVRLAVARYQPDSVVEGDRDVKLSPVVLTDFVQLPPERKAVVSGPTSDGLHKKHAFTVSGPTPILGLKPDRFSIVEVTVLVRRWKGEKDLGWTVDPDAAVVNTKFEGDTRSGEVTMPDDGVPRRLVVQEFQEWASVSKP
jgi:hypothetical protein